MSESVRRYDPIPLWQAAKDEPSLASLAARAQESGERLKAIRALLPAPLRSQIQPGPREGEEWCLLVASPAAAAKLRQLSPALLAHLRSHGWSVQTLRIKIIRPR
jgi:hypothetical protein